MLDFVTEERAVLKEQRDAERAARTKEREAREREAEKECEAREHEAEIYRLHAKEMLEMKNRLEPEKGSFQLHSKTKQEEVGETEDGRYKIYILHHISLMKNFYTPSWV